MGPDLDPNSLTLIVFPKFFFEKVDCEKISRRQEGGKNLPGGKELKSLLINPCPAELGVIHFLKTVTKPSDAYTWNTVD